MLAEIALPGAIGFALTGTLAGAATGALWGGLVRFFLGNHVTYAINSIGHYFGQRASRPPTSRADPARAQSRHRRN